MPTSDRDLGAEDLTVDGVRLVRGDPIKVEINDRLDQIEAKHAEYVGVTHDRDEWPLAYIEMVQDDVPWLISEIKRLRLLTRPAAEQKP